MNRRTCVGPGNLDVGAGVAIVVVIRGGESEAVVG